MGLRTFTMAARALRFATASSAAIAGAVFTTSEVHANADHIIAPEYPFSHKGFLGGFDAGAIRRGHQVYTNVCASCHSMNLLAYRNLVDVCYTEEEVKAICDDLEVEDGPNDEGELFDRPAKLSDMFVAPYKNEDYIFALLTGYREEPAGVSVMPGMHYNPYFAGGQIAMPKQLMDGMMDYGDGTPATASQMAKDVSVYLAWAAA